MSDRKKHISVLKNMLEWMEAASKVASKEERKEAVKYAISSLETDEAYQLMEEQPEFCVDSISREYVEEMIDRCYAASWNENDFYDRLMAELEVTPSVLPKVDKPTIIDWNNCHTPEQLDSIATTKNDLTDQCIACKYDETEDEHGEHCKKCLEGDSQFGLDEALANPTTKNDLGVDAVSRQAVLDIAKASKSNWIDNSILFKRVNELPSVTPQEPKSEWEYDHAILKAYSDGANEVLDKIDEIITDALDKSTDQKESQTLRWVLDKISEVT